MKNLLRFRLLMIVVGLAFAGITSIAQVKTFEQLSAEEQTERLELYKQVKLNEFKGSPILKGATGTLPDLADSYCSDDAPFDVYIDPGNLDVRTTNIRWIIYTGSAAGGDYEEHPGWVSSVGTAPNNGVRFDPANISDPKYYGIPVVFKYFQNDGFDDVDTDYDYTYIRQVPTVFDFGSDASICAGQPTTLTLQGSEAIMEYFLYRDGVNTTPVPLPGTGNAMTFNVTTAGTYEVRARNSTGVTCESTMNGTPVVTLNPLPQLTTDPDQDICVGQSITLNASSTTPGVTFAWDNGDAGPTTTVTPATTTTYAVTVTNTATGCTETGTITVNVHDLPTVTVAYNAPVCVGGTLTLTATPGGGSGTYLNYAWTKDAVVIPGETASSLSITPAALSDAGQYGVIVTDDNNCGSAEDFVDVTIQVLPVPTINGLTTPSVTEMCSGNTLTLTGGGGAVGAIYEWTLPDASAVVSQVLTINNIPATPILGELYTLKVIEGTCEETLDHVVVVNPTPVVTLTSDQVGDEFCDGVNVTFTAGGANEYAFYKNAISPANEVQARSALNTYQDAGLVNGDVIIVEGFDTSFAPATDCSATANVTVVVNDVTATLSISSPGAVICAGTPITFSASAVKTPTDPGETFNYEFRRIRAAVDTQVQDGASNTYVDNALQDGDQIYVVITEGNSGCDDTSASITITVNPNPVVTLTPSTNPICDGVNVTFTATGGFANYEFFLNTISQVSGASNTYSNATLADGDQLYVTATSAAGCSASSAPPVVMTVNPLANPTLTGDFTPCVNTTETYSTDPGYSNYVWTVTGGSVSGGGNGSDFVDVDWNTTGIQTLTVSYETADGCPPATPTSQSITVNSLPTVTLGGETDVCLNSVETYTTETGMTNYVWIISGGTEQTNDNNGTITVLWNTLGSGSVSVNYDNSNGCGASSPTVSAVTVHDLPVPTISGNTPVCLNTTEQYTTEGGYSNYQWNVVGGTITPTANPHIVDVLWTSTGNQSISVNYEASAGACSAAVPTVFPVFVNDLPVPTITGPAAVCENSSANVYTTEAAMTAYVWTIVGGTIDSGNGTNSVSVTWNTSGPQTISVSYTNGNGCGAAIPSPYAVTVNALPVPSITGAATVCNGTSGIYSTEGSMSNYVWTISAGGTITNGQGTESIDVDWTVNGPQIITVTYTDGNGCDAATPTPTTVTVVDLPTPTITGDAVVCEGHTITYTTEGGGNNYDWQIVGGTITPTAQPHIVDVVWTLGVGREISVNYELAACPAATPAVLPVTVNAIPTVTLTGPTEACLNTTGHVYSTESGQNNYQWTVVGGSITNGLGTDQITVTWDVLGAGSVSVNYDNSSSCSAVNPTLINVTVHPLPVPTISGNANVCNTYREVYTTETGMSAYNWVVVGGVVDIDDNNGRVEVLWYTTGAQSISVSYANGNSCDPASPTLLNVTVLDTPAPTISGDAVVCNDNVTTYNTEAGHTNYVWTISGGSIIAGDATEAITVLWDTPGAQQISVNYELASGCTAEAATVLDVTVNPLSGISLTAAPATSVIAGTEITFTGAGTDVATYDFKVNGVLDAGHDGSDTYRWTPATIADDQSVIRVIATTSNGCKDSTELTISVFEGLIPSDVEPLTQIYCEGDPSAVSIYVLPPVLVGVTYELTRIEDSQSIGTVVVIDASTEVRWTHGVNGVDLTYAGTATYMVESYWAIVPGDRIEMNNRVTVTETALPDDSYSIDPVGTVTGCNAGNGYDITLNGSEAGMVYTLYVDGVTTGTPQVGTGGALNFGTQYLIGTYQIVADNNGCTIPMTGTFTVQTDFTGIPQNVTGNPADGRYCAGGAGVEIMLESSEESLTYIVFWNGTELMDPGSAWTSPADGDSHTFGPYPAAGDYTINVQTMSGCYESMNGVVTVIPETPPMAFNLLAENNIPSYCPGSAGVKLLLENKQAGVRYRLYQDGTEVENILVNTDGGQLLFVGDYLAATYSVTAEIDGISSCSVNMNNDVVVVEDPEATVRDLMGETSYCEGGGSASLYINNPETDVVYELMLDSNPTGDFGTISGGQITWTVSAEGQYTVRATKNNTNTSCGPVFMNGAIDVVMTALPQDRVLTVVDGTDCANGTVITIPNTENGIRYVVVSMATDMALPGYEIIGDGSSTLSFAELFDADGYYRVEAYNGTCSQIIDDTFNNPIHVQIAGVVAKLTIDYTPSGPICVGDGGLTVQVHNPETNVDYVLYRIDGSGTDVEVERLLQPQSGDPIAFAATFTEGEYKVIGYEDVVNDPTGCSNEMLNRLTIVYNALPKSYRLTGADKYCSSDPAILSLDGSELGYEYTLLRNDGTGNIPIETLFGTGEVLEFGAIAVDGIYTVFSMSPVGCTSSMRDTVTVSAAPADITMQVATANVYEYCESDGSTTIVLTDQQTDVLYQAIDKDGVVAAEILGTTTGSTLDLGPVSMEGKYAIWASYNGLGCLTWMNNTDSVEVIVTPEPEKKTVTADAYSVCGADGATITLTASQVGIEYYIYDGVLERDTLMGDGSDLNWMVSEAVSGPYSYQIIAIANTTCNSVMGTIDITFKDGPTPYTMFAQNGMTQFTDTIRYCADGDGIEIGVNSTQSGIGYILHKDFTEEVGFFSGDGSNRIFSGYFKGAVNDTVAYSVRAVNFNTGCAVEWSDTIQVIEDALPEEFNVELLKLSGSIDDCSVLCRGLTGVDQIQLESSVIGYTYSLLHNDVAIDPAVDSLGTGNLINFGVRADGGYYTVEATTGQGCKALMNGKVQLYQDPLVAIDDVLSIRYGTSEGDTSVWVNDIHDMSLDSIAEPNKNIYFELVDPTKPNEREIVQLSTTVGNQVEIYPDGKLIFTKKPSFYGRDSVDYVVYNTTYPERRDTATVYFFVGNIPVDPENDLLIPNAFSPNGDGINDYYVIDGQFKNEVAESKLEVFNRWGTVIFRSKGKYYEDDWDGKSNSGDMVSLGDDLPNGTYFYVFGIKVNKGNDTIETKEYSGFIELRR